MRSRVTLLTTLFIVLALASACGAGQIASHIYTAIKMKDHLSPACRLLVDSNMDAYLAGAQGPDIVGVVQSHISSASTVLTATVGEESHYTQTGELTRNILYAAKTPKEQAFALGWITHYLNDVQVHTLVNQWGGYYLVDAAYHKALEQLESKYVYAKHSAVVDKSTATSCPADLGPDFATFIAIAYSRTYPANPLYKLDEVIGQVQGLDARTRLEHFCEQFRRASSWCLDAANSFYGAHESNEGKQTRNVQWAIFPAQPNKDQYKNIMNPLEMEVNVDTANINVVVKVNDNKMYGRFLNEWEQAAARAIQEAAKVLPVACQYVEAKTEDDRKKIRPLLAPLLPDVNLDQPDTAFNMSTIDPGNHSADHIILDWIPLSQPKKGYQFVQAAYNIKIPELKDGGWNGSKTGKVEFNIPLKDYSGDFQLRVKLIQNAKLKGFDYLEYQGKTQQASNTSDGSTMMGDVFEASFTIPADLAGKPGARRYFIMSKDEEVALEDVMMIQGRLESPKMRFDVAAIDENISGTTLKAKLQVTNLESKKLTGDQKLVMMWFPEGKNELDLGGLMNEANEALASAGAAIEELNKAMERQEEMEEELDRQLQAYAAELEKNPKLTSKQKEEMIEKKALELMKEMNADVEGSLQDSEDIKNLEAKGDIPFYATAPLTLRPASTKVAGASGWDDVSGPSPYANGREFGRKIEEKTSSGSPRTKVLSSFGVAFFDDPQMKKDWEQRWASSGAEAISLTVAGFKGTVYETSNEAEKSSAYADGTSHAGYTGKLEGEGFLEKGKVLMRIRYSIEAEGTSAYDKEGKLIYDGVGPAREAFTSDRKDIGSMMRGIGLQPGS